MSSTTTLLLFTLLVPLANATGHLRLELTASHDCAVRLSTSSILETLHLKMGSKKTSSFHPSSAQIQREKEINVEFSMVGNSKMVTSEKYHLKMESQDRKTFEFGEIVLVVESVFECDNGFTGENCDERIVDSSSSSSTTTTTTTTSTTTTSAPTSTTATVSSPGTLKVLATSKNGSSSPSTTLIAVLSIVIFCLVLLVIAILCLLCRRSSSRHIYIEPVVSSESPALGKKNLDVTTSEDGSPRYKPAPFTSSVLITLC